MPAGATELTLPIRVTGDDVAIVGTFVGRDGRFVMADFGRTRGRTPVVLRVPVRGQLEGARLLGLRFARVSEVESHAKGSGPILRGVAILGPLSAHGADGAKTLVSRYDGWTGAGGARSAPPFGPNAVDYFVSESAEAFFRLRQPTDDRPLAAVVSPGLAELANDDGLLAVQLPAGTVTLRVVGTVRHFPSVLGPAVVIDRDALGVALPALQPGAGVANELWLDTPSPDAVAKALAQPPFDALQVESRAGAPAHARRRSADARDDPAAARGDGDRAAARAAGRVLPRGDRRSRRPRRAARPRDAGRRAAGAAAPPAAAAAARRGAGHRSAARSPGCC